MGEKRKVTFKEDEDFEVEPSVSSILSGRGHGDDSPVNSDEENRTGGKRRKPIVENDDGEEEEEDVDSDGEVDGAKYQLGMDDVEGQESGTLAFNDAGEMFTPFNLEEEEQEGHFDKDGMYQFRKNNNTEDAWLESVNWTTDVATNVMPNAEDIEDSDSEPPVNKAAELRLVLNMLQPGETVPKALKRLGGNGPGEKKRWHQKGKRRPEEDQRPASQADELLALTRAADRLLQCGFYDIYANAREQLAEQGTLGLPGRSKIAITKAPLSKKHKTTPAALDMFAGDDADVGQYDQSKSKDGEDLHTGNSDTTNVAEVPGVTPSEEDSVQWEYKWSDDAAAEVYGPFTSNDMDTWKQAGMFGVEVMVRKKGESNFYQCSRIDFDLYI